MASANISQLASKLESVLQCAICLDLFNEPRTLICGHVFCRVCLRRLIGLTINAGGIPCPTCRQMSNSADIKEVSILNDVVHFQKSISTRLCDVCKNGTVMDNLWRCDGCEVKMTCSKCMVKKNHGSKCDISPLSLAEYLAEKQNQLVEWRNTVYQPCLIEVNSQIDRFSAQHDAVHRRILTIREVLMGEIAGQNGEESMVDYLARITAFHTFCDGIIACYRSEISAIHQLVNRLVQMSAVHPSDLDVKAMEECQGFMAEIMNRLKTSKNKIDRKLVIFQRYFVASDIRIMSAGGDLDGQAAQQAIVEVMISELGIPTPIDGAPVNPPMHVDDSNPVIDSEDPIGDHTPVDDA